jgi:hypothetical protein
VEPPAEPAPIEQEEPAPAPAPAFQPELMIGEREPRETTGELEEIEADDEIFELLPPPEPVEEEASGETYGETSGAEHTVQPPPQEDSLQVLAYHLGGVANLPTGRDGLDLRLSESGLDILQREGEIIGRLHWEEIDALEVVAVRGRLRRQARTLSRIVVRTKHGDASFEIPGLSSEDLEARVEPLVSRYASA